MSKIVQGRFKILANEKLGRGYFKMLISAPAIARRAKPGQFVHLRCQEGIQPLLRRPFSFHRISKNTFEILYKVVGQGTNLLAKKQKGDKIDMLGPLGTGFPLQPTTYNLQPILVAGGMGVAPLLALAQRLPNKRKTVVLLGAKTKQELLCAAEFKGLSAQVQITTDDGSQGFKGLVTNLLIRMLRNTKYEIRYTIYACGPNPMLKAVAAIAKQYKALAYGSLEERMACGVGACLGCAVSTRAGYKQACKDGPVFNLREIVWGKK